MVYAVVRDIPWSWEQYAEIAAATMVPLPNGLFVHLAGPTDEGVRTIDVWEEESDWRHYQDELLSPSITRRPGPIRPEPTVRCLQVLHLTTAADSPRDLAPRADGGRAG